MRKFYFCENTQIQPPPILKNISFEVYSFVNSDVFFHFIAENAGNILESIMLQHASPKQNILCDSKQWSSRDDRNMKQTASMIEKNRK